MTDARARRRYPLTTYRLQLRPEFGFADARAVVPYLDSLGVTDCYTSPYLTPSPGSNHGYDICDHRHLNPELGTREDYEAFSAELHASGLGHLVDVVPNHMAADPVSNSWWRDVLEHGQASPYSEFFDIDWRPIKPELRGRVLLPILGDQYGRVLERGDLRLAYADGAVVVRYGDTHLPLDPQSLPQLLDGDDAAVDPWLTGDDADARELLSILTALDNLPAHTERDADRRALRQREHAVARDRLARLVASSDRARQHIESRLLVANGEPGRSESFDLLHEVLERQAYRLAYWRTAFDEINYRRFFDVNGLVGLRMEAPGVFEATHGLLESLVAEGHITGFRVDHPDGLFDPQLYLERLERMGREAQPLVDPDDGLPGRFYVVVEKILSAGEELRADWPVAGTTGYDFLNLVAGLFIDGRNAPPLRRTYARLTGRTASFPDVAYECKRVITLTSMASELSVLAHALNRLSERDRLHRDFTLDSCRKALREVLAACSVYRTYLNERGISPFGRGVLLAAIEEALRRDPVMEESIFDFIRDVLLPPEGTAEGVVAARRRFAMQFQQFSGPVQAKGVEDTAFYRHHVLVAANDVGGHPARLGVSPAEFHEANARRLAKQPFGMLSTSTHDTKRGEDARVRLAVLSEMPDDWRRTVSEWMRLNTRHRTQLDSLWAPDRNDEYLCYQAMLGAWPAETDDAPVPDRAPDEFVARIDAYMQKAVREAKVHTSWIDKDQEYGAAVGTFVKGVLTGRTSRKFLATFVPFARRLARAGAVNSLAQLVLKAASPGVPDFYQGTEFWDLSLVDPDNRRLVDFPGRAAALDALMPIVSAAESGTPVADRVAPLVDAWPDGRVKLLVTARALRFRRDRASFMMRADYLPLEVEGPAADRIVAFARRHTDEALVVVVPRLVADILAPAGLALRPDTLAGTRIRLPGDLAAAYFRHVITGEAIVATDGSLDAAALLRTLPAAMLHRTRFDVV